MPKSKMTNRATLWSGTQFNITAFEGQQNAAKQKGWTCLGQLEECPETKRQHYQFAVKTGQVRMSEVCKTFQGAHIEVCRNKDALLQYVNKKETRVGELPPVSDLYPTLDATLTMFVQYLRDQERNPANDDEGFRTRLSGDKWLTIFDEWVENVAIAKQRLRIETLAINPATRSAVKRYMNGIYTRHSSEIREEESRQRDLTWERQTDRQTVEINVAEDSIQEDAGEHQEEDDEELPEEDSEQVGSVCSEDEDLWDCSQSDSSFSDESESGDEIY